jgi:hypothetical protein
MTALTGVLTESTAARIRRLHGDDVVRLLVGALLLAAAALKGHELATGPVVEQGLLTSRWFLTIAVEFELALGLCLLGGLWKRAVRAVALACFVGFAGLTAYKTWHGDASCGCFGRVSIPPQYTLVLDVAVVVALLAWRPRREELRPAWRHALGIGCVVGSVTALLAVLFGVREYTRLGAHGAPSIIVGNAPARPHEVAMLARRLFAVGGPEDQLTRSVLARPWRTQLDASGLCHLLMRCGRGKTPEPAAPSGGDAINLLTGGASPGSGVCAPIVFRTRDGARYELLSPGDSAQRDGEAHRDAILATLALQGVPLTFPVQTKDGACSVRDLLADALAHFDLQQREIPWTAMAIILYLPPQSRWTNCDGESFCFDDLSRELLGRRLDESPCGGTHLLEALTLLLRVDDKCQCLSPAARGELHRQLARYVHEAERSQARNGSWAPGWWQDDAAGLERSPARTGSLLITGHVLEWMQYLPLDLQPPDATYRRGADWLCARIRELPSEIEPATACPLTHAIMAVQNLIQTPGDRPTATIGRNMRQWCRTLGSGCRKDLSTEKGR